MQRKVPFIAACDFCLADKNLIGLCIQFLIVFRPLAYDRVQLGIKNGVRAAPKEIILSPAFCSENGYRFEPFWSEVGKRLV